MSMGLRLFLGYRRVVLFGLALYALRKLPKGVELSYRRLWHHIGLELERFYSSR
jgi:hypothetical protein